MVHKLHVVYSYYKGKATIGCKLVSHQGFSFKSMRAGGHYHYSIMTFNRKLTIKMPLCKQNHNIPSSQPVHDTPTNASWVQQSSACPSLVPRPHPKEGGVTLCACTERNNGIMAKIWRMHFFRAGGG